MRNRKTILAALSVVGVAVLVLAGGLMASNMGFKLNLPLVAAAGGVSASGTNYIGVPYNQQVGLVTAKDLFLDIQKGGAIQFLNQHRKIDDGFEVYTFGGGTLAPNGWNLTAGEAYIAKVGADQNYIIVGSHNPGLTISLVGAGAGSASGTNYYVHPYHGVATNARELFLEIGGDVQFLNQHRKIDDGFEVYTFGGGTLPPDGWPLQAGEGYIVKIGSDKDFVPQHY
jgi:hypothetical protein